MSIKIAPPYIRAMKMINQYGKMPQEMPQELITQLEQNYIHGKIRELLVNLDRFNDEGEEFYAKVCDQKIQMAYKLLDHAVKRSKIKKNSWVVIQGTNSGIENSSKPNLVLIKNEGRSTNS